MFWRIRFLRHRFSCRLKITCEIAEIPIAFHIGCWLLRQSQIRSGFCEQTDLFATNATHRRAQFIASTFPVAVNCAPCFSERRWHEQIRVRLSCTSLCEVVTSGSARVLTRCVFVVRIARTAMEISRPGVRIAHTSPAIDGCRKSSGTRHA